MISLNSLSTFTLRTAFATAMMLGLAVPAFAAGSESDETKPPEKTETKQSFAA